MKSEIPPGLNNRVNQALLERAASLSAHSDVADALLQAVKPLGDVQVFCPDPAEYRYVLVSTRNIIFGFASGMNQISLRLDARLRARALVTGAANQQEYGEEWVSFTLFRDDWPRPDLEFWARKAYVFARETAVSAS